MGRELNGALTDRVAGAMIEQVVVQFVRGMCGHSLLLTACNYGCTLVCTLVTKWGCQSLIVPLGARIKGYSGWLQMYVGMSRPMCIYVGYIVILLDAMHVVSVSAGSQ